MNLSTKCIVLSAIILAISGCLSGSDSKDSQPATSGGAAADTNGSSETAAAVGGQATGGGQDSSDMVSDGASNTTTPKDCAFDESLKGKAVGKQIEDFPLQSWSKGVDGTFEPSRFDFHSYCGGGARAIWVFLSTGWCSACENYAVVVQEQYARLKDKGLRVVWIVGEDAEKAPPSQEYMQLYASKKMVDFPIIRDGDFLQTKRFIDPSVAGNSLPRSYVIDARNMEMKYAGGIAMDQSMCAMLAEMNETVDGIDCP